MQVETLTRERSALVWAALSRALMLERQERSTDLFARVVRARKELSELFKENPNSVEDIDSNEVR